MSIRDSPEWREDVLSIAYIYYSAKLLGLDADTLLEEIAQMSNPGLAGLMRQFVNRPLEATTLRKYLLHIVQTPNGPAIDWLP
jgi:hypothetical protein